MIDRLSLAAALALAAPGAVAQDQQRFTSIEVRGGAEVRLLGAHEHRLRIVTGDPRGSAVAVDRDGRLRIDGCANRCSTRERLVVEVHTPFIAAVRVLDGGTIRAGDGMAPQGDIRADVENGGTIDLRTLALRNAHATVRNGGRILVRPSHEVRAAVAEGGLIVYRRGPRVVTSVTNGGRIVSEETLASAAAGRPVGAAAFDGGPTPPTPPDVLPPR